MTYSTLHTILRRLGVFSLHHPLFNLEWKARHEYLRHDVREQLRDRLSVAKHLWKILEILSARADHFVLRASFGLYKKLGKILVGHE